MAGSKKKRKLKLLAKIIIVVVIIGIFAGIGCVGYLYRDKIFSAGKKTISNVTKSTVQAKKESVDYEARLFMVGDALIHDSLYRDAQTDSGYDFKPMIEYIKPISSKYDLVYYNQETILGGPELGYSNYPRFNSPYEVGDAFLDAGFNLVSLATNHTMDKGEAGVLNSVAYWKSKGDAVVYSGQWNSFEDRTEQTSRIYEKNGIKYAFLSYTTWTNGLETPNGKEYLNNVYSPEKAAEDIGRVKDKADVIIVAMHWGTEYSLGVDYSQTTIANYLSSLGVQIIIGAHPHVVEPVEYINDGKTFVIYSLGNLISDQEGNEKLTGLMMELTIRKHIDVDGKSTISIEHPKAELTYTKSYYGGKRNFKVYPYSKLDSSILSNYQEMQNKYFGIVKSRYPELEWGVTGD